MIKHLPLVLLTAALPLTLSACKDNTETVTAAQSIEMPVLLNPNTASYSDMTAAGVDGNAVSAFMANRPFLDGGDTFAPAGVRFARWVNQNGWTDALEFVFIPLPLNSTDEADFKFIPGVGDKMAHEFVEYRPYSDMAQFDREISKYVDAEELARLRRYVIVD